MRMSAGFRIVRLFPRLLSATLLLAAIGSASPAFAQGIPLTQQQMDALRNDPAALSALRQRIQESGKTPAEIRSQLIAAGYSPNLLDGMLPGARDTTVALNE